MAQVIRMPRLSDTMEEGNIVSWLRKVGDTVEVGDILAEVETDKATMELESFYNGVLLHIGVAEGAVPVDGVIAVIGKKGEVYDPSMLADAPVPKAAAAVETPAVVAAPVVAVVETPAIAAASHNDDRILASPLARKIAAEAGLEIAAIKGSGDEGRIVKRDVEAALNTKTAPVQTSSTQNVPAQAATSALASHEYTDHPLSSMRKTIARRLSESLFTAPHFYLTMEINMNRAKEVRAQLNTLSPTKLSFNDMVVKAVAMSLREHPAINSSWMGDFIRENKVVNVGVAVAVGEGLVVPVVRNTDMKSLSQIATEVRDMATRAKDGKLGLDEMKGNTFTISNLGMFGIDEFTAIINPPDACILAVGAIAEKVIVVNGEMQIASIMKVTLSCDHRVVDGAKGAAFLQTLQAKLEEPMRLLV
jgi:pyruvate dehydrogenase E2 component (dihydrolipoamide acetyltransferase)